MFDFGIFFRRRGTSKHEDTIRGIDGSMRWYIYLVSILRDRVYKVNTCVTVGVAKRMC